MKSTLKMSLVLVALLLTFSLLLTGCGQEEINVKIDDNAAKAQTAVNDAAKKAHDDLASAVAKLETLVNSGNTASAASLTEAVAELNAAIEAAKTAATGADASLKAALEAAIAAAKTEAVTASQSALDAAKAELEAADLANAADVVAKVKVLNDAIAAATDAAGNAITNLKEELTIAIASAKKDALDAVEAAKVALTNALNEEVEALQTLIEANDADISSLVEAKNAAVTAIENLNTLIAGVDAKVDTATAKALADAKDYVVEVMKGFNDETANVVTYIPMLGAAKDAIDSDFYSAEKYAALVSAYDVAWIKIMRATAVGVAQNLYEEYVALINNTNTLADDVYDLLTDFKADVDEIRNAIGTNNEEAADKFEILVTAGKKTLVENAYTAANAVPSLSLEMGAYGENDVNLHELYELTNKQYDKLMGAIGGAVVKAKMQAINAVVISPLTAGQTDELALVRDAYDNWASAVALTKVSDEWVYEDVVNVAFPDLAKDGEEDFESVITKFIAAEKRMADLLVAKSEAEVLNARIETLLANIAAKGATTETKAELDTLVSDVADWDDLYFDLNADGTLADADEAINYAMVKHDNDADHKDLATAKANYAQKLEEQTAAFANFRDAVDALREKDITLMLYDEINNALDLYDLFVIKTGDDTFGMIFHDANGNPVDPALYYVDAVNFKTQYNALKAEATVAYADALTNSGLATLTLNNIDIYDDLSDVRDWYDAYVKNAIGEGYNFANNNGDLGYALNGGLTITEAMYNDFVALENALAALVDAKETETENLIADITAQLPANAADVTTALEDEIEALLDRYTAWLNGANVATANVEGAVAAQFAIDTGSTLYEITNITLLNDAKARLDELLGYYNTARSLLTALPAYSTYAEIAADTALTRDAYNDAITAAETAVQKFYSENKNSYDGRIVDADLAKITNAKMAVYKYDQIVAAMAYGETIVVAVDDLADDALETVFETLIEDVDAVVIETTLDDAKADIDAFVVVAAAQADGIKSAYDKYEAAKATVEGYGLTTTKAAALGDLEVAYERILVKISTGYYVEAPEVGAEPVFVEITEAAQVTELLATFTAELAEILDNYKPHLT